MTADGPDRIQVTLPGGEVKEVPRGSRAEDLLHATDLTEELIAVKVNGKVRDVYTSLDEDCTLEPVLTNTEEGLDVLRHTSAHVMAQAVSRLFPHVEFAIGPVIDDGFYYDFDLPHNFTPEDLPKIEEEMKKIVWEDLPVRRLEMDKGGALDLLGEQDAKFKSEIVGEKADEEVISFYRQGEFTDLCTGPHLPRTGLLKSFKLLSIAGAYWRGDERREMLQRVYATAFFRAEDLEEFLHIREEAKKRDHRKIGKEMDLFSFQPEAPGVPFWHPKGSILYDAVVDHLKEKLEPRGYGWIRTPMILNEDLWRKSGHWEHYKENMYFTEIDEAEFAVKPMNCPGGTRVFNDDHRSYRDLPIRMAELGLCHRHEKSGVLTGLFRVRAFTQDDAHIYCTPEQIEEEVIDLIDLTMEVYRDYGYDDVRLELSTRPARSTGTAEMWRQAEGALKAALERKGLEHEVNPGDGAFYGPKIDFHIKDAIKRSWQCGTIQVDFSMPERFDLSYIGEDDNRHRPVMIHRAILGSVERFIGILIENFGGAFPTWLAPEQVRVIPVSQEKQGEYAAKVFRTLREAGVRVFADRRQLRVGKQIAEARNARVPYALVIGGKEEEAGAVAVTRRGAGNCGAMPLEEFRDQVVAEARSRAAELAVGGDPVPPKPHKKA